MLIKLIPVADLCNAEELRGTTAIVFDVLRATSTIVTALASGFRRVIPVAEVNDAAKLARDNGFVLAGERGGKKIQGFEHGNSPLEFSSGPQTESNTLVLTTSNGTRAICKAFGADAVFIGSILNARAVALAALNEKRDIYLVCAGTAGNFSLEDALGAGFVLREIIQAMNSKPEMDDLAMASYTMASYYQNEPFLGLAAGRHGKVLLNLGCEEDLHWCAKLNRYDIAPQFNGSYIR